MSVERIKPADLKKTLLVWWRYGREHDEDNIRINPPDFVQTRIRRQVDIFRQTPADAWRWWQVDENLIVEQWNHARLARNDTFVYYMLNEGLAVVENIHFPPPDDQWKWYIHLAEHLYDSQNDAWLMKDLFLDVLVAADNRTCYLVDLPDLACAMEAGLLSMQETCDLLRRADQVTHRIYAGEFPFPLVEKGQQAVKALGWNPAPSESKRSR